MISPFNCPPLQRPESCRVSKRELDREHYKASSTYQFNFDCQKTQIPTLDTKCATFTHFNFKLVHIKLNDVILPLIQLSYWYLAALEFSNGGQMNGERIIRINRIRHETGKCQANMLYIKRKEKLFFFDQRITLTDCI